MNTNSYYKSKKFKYGSVATAFTIAFIAIIVIFNIIFSALANKYLWYIDMTEKQVFSLSEEAINVMSDITEDVNIYFASEPDMLMNGENAGMTRYIYNTALQLADKFPNVNVECVSVAKNPGFFREFYETAATEINTTSVIVNSGKEVRIFAASAFYDYNDLTDLSTVWAYNGEKKLLGGIMQVTQSATPKVGFITQHGEDLSALASLGFVFEDNGYEIINVNLAQDTLDEDCRILVVSDPLYDYIGEEAEDPSKNEIEKLDKFLDNYGCLLVMCSPEKVGNLKNLNGFLEEWGIRFMADTTVRDMSNSMSVDGYSILADYQKDTEISNIYKSLNDLATPPKTIIRKAAPIELLWEKGGGLSGTRATYSILKSASDSEIIRDGSVVGKGSYNVATITAEVSIVDNEYFYSYVMAIGSPSFASQSYLTSNAYVNEDIISACMKYTGRERVLAAIDLKPFDTDEITITTADANQWTVIMTVLLPAIVGVLGAVVIIRRKHS